MSDVNLKLLEVPFTSAHREPANVENGRVQDRQTEGEVEFLQCLGRSRVPSSLESWTSQIFEPINPYLVHADFFNHSKIRES